MGNAWAADYLKITGELDVDLRSNIAAEARAKIVYERLVNFTTDAGTKDALQFLMTREITHMRAFTAALESLKKPRFSCAASSPETSWRRSPLKLIAITGWVGGKHESVGHFRTSVHGRLVRVHFSTCCG